MALPYVPTTWKSGDLVSSTRLNKLEGGVKENSDAIVTNTADISQLKSQIEEMTAPSKNLLPQATNTATVNLVTATYDHGVITLSGTSTGTGGRLTSIISFKLPAGTYTFSTDNTDVQWFLEVGSSIIAQLQAYALAATFTLNAETSVYIGTNVTSGITYNTSAHLQLEVGSEATRWEKPGFVINENLITSVDAVPTWFDNIVCIGDSLTASLVYTSASATRQAKATYPQALAKITGTTVTSIANSGYSAKQWWAAHSSEIVSATNQLAIIYLGTNGGFTDTLATDAPPDTDPSTWDDTTDTGCLALIINAYQTVGAKIVLVKLYASSGNIDTSNKVLTDCANRFHTGLVENKRLGDALYHYWPNLSGTNTVHYNDIGYSVFAAQLAKNIVNMNSKYLKYLIPSAT